MTTTTGTADRHDCRAFPSVRRENVGLVSDVSDTVVSMSERVFTAGQKGNPTTAQAILRIAPPPQGWSKRQAETEIRVDLFRRHGSLGFELWVGGRPDGRPAAGGAATAGGGLSRHGAVLYPTSPLPATTPPPVARWRPGGFPVTSRRQCHAPGKPISRPGRGRRPPSPWRHSRIQAPGAITRSASSARSSLACAR